LALALLFIFTDLVCAETFLLKLIGRNSVVGELKHAVAKGQDTLVEIARRNDIGYDEVVKANPTVDRWVPGENTQVLIPSLYVLPDVDYDGIVINLAELRLYYFVSKNIGNYKRVYTFPVSIGRMDWKTPLGKTKVISKEKDPAWIPPESIKAEHAADGDYLPDIIPGGIPENPLGHFALRLGFRNYLIHGTDAKKELGIGMRVTHGCIRMYPEDIEKLYNLVETGTPVHFVDQPIKVGWNGPELLVEVHTPLEEDKEDFLAYSHRVSLDELVAMVNAHKTSNMQIDLRLLEEILRRGDGIPTVIGRLGSVFPPARAR
jgi:L,D-transpeptidase ErfK/SrfK